MVQLVGDFQLEEVVYGEEVEHSAVHTSLEEGVLVLGQPHIVQPACHPLQMIIKWNKGATLISPDGRADLQGLPFPAVVPEVQDKPSFCASGFGSQASTLALDL